MIELTDLIEVCMFGMGVLLITNIWLIVRVLHPLRRLTNQLVGLTEGDLAALQQPCGGIREIEALRRSMDGMVGHVRRAQEQSRTYADVLTNGQEAERARIARELHDDTTQSLIAISQSIDLARNWITSNPARASEILQAARQQAVETIEALRCLIADLRPPALEELGLVAALEMQADKTNDLSVSVKVEGVERRLGETHELVLFRCAQEALTNTRRHGQATQVDITVAYRPEGTYLMVNDNGSGFEIPTHLNDLAINGHYGLLGIQERIQHLNGAISISSDRGNGTTLQVCLPNELYQQPPHVVRDPVCSAVIEPHQAYGSAEHKGERYYFCCPVCQGAFQRDPETYLQTLDVA